jgi:hypothetical protein
LPCVLLPLAVACGSSGPANSGGEEGSGTSSGNGSGGGITSGSTGGSGTGSSGALEGGQAGSGSTSSSSSGSSGGSSTGGTSSGGSNAGSTSSGSSGVSSSSSGGGQDASSVQDAGTVDATTTADASTGDAGTTTGALIQNDVFWKDTSGNPIYSQGGGVLQVGSTYYWYGVEYGGAATYEANTKKNSDTSFVAVPCYSSTDLAHWKFEGNALTAASIGATGWVGRLGAAYNATTKKYVLVMQYTGNNGTGELFATSSTPNGAFTYDNVQATITNVVNNTSGDQAVFNDDDGQAYLVFSNSSGRSHLYVAPLRPADFLAVQPATQVYSSSAGGREGNCMFKYGGRYYINSSDLHGWNASHTYYISASNIMGPYSAEAVIGNTDADFSHVTQSGLFVTVKGTSQSTVIFGGDRWADFAGNGIGYNQWMPLTFNGTAPSMASLSQWSLDATSGKWSVGPGNNYALNPSFEADRVAMTQPAGWVTSTTTSGATPYTNASGGHTGNWKWQLTDTAAYEASLNQTVTNLPSGTYTLSAWVESSGGQSVAQLFAKNFGGSEMDASISKAMGSWTHVSISGINVTSGQMDIGVSTNASANQWVSVDDFTLVKN